MAAVYPALLVADAPSELPRKPARQPQQQVKPVESLLARLLGAGGSVMCPRRQITVSDEGRKSSAAETDPERGRVQSLAQRVLGEKFRVRDNQLTPTACEEMVKNIRSCSYFGENAGSNDFYKGTLGFHLKFRDTHRRVVEEKLPFLAPALDAMLRPECNVFYLNVIFARPDGQPYHVDNFFTEYSGCFRPTDLVSVAYLSSEPGAGGDLLLYSKTCEDSEEQSGGAQADTILQRVAPSQGRVVDFDGRLFHAVEGFTPGETPRVSIVVEQCKLPRRHFMLTPKCSVYCQATNKEIDLA